jgi:hypothetical protein
MGKSSIEAPLKKHAISCSISGRFSLRTQLGGRNWFSAAVLSGLRNEAPLEEILTDYLAFACFLLIFVGLAACHSNPFSRPLDTSIVATCGTKRTLYEFLILDR